jgi:hypothetical protein
MQPHTTDTIPTNPGAIVRVDLGDGCPVVDRADAFNWGPGAGPEGEGRIQGFEVLDTPQPRARPALASNRHRVAAQRGPRRSTWQPHNVANWAHYQ